ncbi:MAG: mechanosensitive ion channel family protein [Burkholderiales bacterium]|nr:mechanosensitive ion channel family protein [Burkholderiales bacterium]
MATAAGGWFSQWHLLLSAAIVVAALAQRQLTRHRAESGPMLRNNLLFCLACFLASLLIHPLALLNLRQAASLLDELTTLSLGLLLIRICGLTAFRVLLPRLGFAPPAILEDILLVLTYIAWGMVRLRTAGLDLTGIVTTSAVITGLIAFSMQETLGNILGGLALQLDNSVRIGDWICIDDVRGQVMEVHWRHTDVCTTNGHLIVVPNSLMMKAKVDVYSRIEMPQFRRWIKFWVGDNIAPQDVINTVHKALREAQIDYVATNPPVECIDLDCRGGAIEYAVRYWLLDPRHDDGTDSRVRVHFYSALKRANYSLAHPCMDVNLVNPAGKAGLAQQEHELARRQKALRRVSLFAKLSDDEIAQIAASLRVAPFVKNDVMTKQGAVAHWLYLLVEGEADVWLENHEQRTHLATLKEGDVFGEMGLLTGAARSATVTARSDALCYRLDKEMFATILHQRPELANEFAHILSQRSQEQAALKIEHASEVGHEAHNYLSSIRKFFRLVH